MSLIVAEGIVERDAPRAGEAIPACVVAPPGDWRHHSTMTQAAQRSRLRAFVSRLDLGYTLPLVLAVAAFVGVVLAYFGVL